MRSLAEIDFDRDVAVEVLGGIFVIFAFLQKDSFNVASDSRS